MNASKIIAISIAAAGIAGLSGCDVGTLSPGGDLNLNGVGVRGRIAVTGNVANLKVCLEARNICVTPDASGNYDFSKGGTTLTGASGARVLAADSANDSTKASGAVVDSGAPVIQDSATAGLPAVDTVKVIAGETGKTRTVAEIPVTNWNSVLPTPYIVARSFAVTTSYPMRDKPELIYWTREDSSRIAHVVKTGSVGSDYSAFIYAVYDSVTYEADDTVFTVFARGVDTTGLLWVSKDTMVVSAKAGNPGKALVLEPRGPFAPMYKLAGVEEGKDVGEVVDTVVVPTKLDKRYKLSFAKYNEVGMIAIVNGKTVLSGDTAAIVPSAVLVRGIDPHKVDSMYCEVQKDSVWVRLGVTNREVLPTGNVKPYALVRNVEIVLKD